LKKEVEKSRKRHNEFMVLSEVPAFTTVEQVRALYRDLNRPEKFRDHIRVLRIIYGLKKEDLPKIGSGSSELELNRLYEAVIALIHKHQPLPPKVPIPSVYPEYPLGAAPTEEALALHAQHQAKAAAAMSTLMASANNGVVFSASRMKRRGQAISASHMALEGTEFEEEGIMWKIIDVRYSKKIKTMVVWYCDMELAALQEVTMEEMIDKRNEDKWGDCEPLECSSVEEVNAWIAASSEQHSCGRGGSQTSEDEEDEDEGEDDDEVPWDMEDDDYPVRDEEEESDEESKEAVNGNATILAIFGIYHKTMAVSYS
jgi:hypothetical protein